MQSVFRIHSKLDVLNMRRGMETKTSCATASVMGAALLHLRKSIDKFTGDSTYGKNLATLDLN